jgi:hypothetical protein
MKKQSILSPHMSTQSDTKDRIASSIQEFWKSPNNTMPSSCGEADVATLSFQALSLQQTSSSQPQTQSQTRPSLVLDEEHLLKPRMRGRRCRSEDFDLRATISTSTIPSGDQERPSMLRKVSLELKVPSPINYFGGAMDDDSLDDIPKAFSFPQEPERPKRRRHPSTSSLISEEEEQPSPKTHKRRRLANRNRGLTSTDFDLILSQIGVGGGL